MYLCLVVILDDCLISKGEADDYGLITIADFNISWISIKVKVGEPYIDVWFSWVKVGWTDTNVEVSWTAFWTVCSELRLIEVFEDGLLLSVVDWRHF